VLGAGGGVGSFTVQFAKALGGHVTATTSTSKVETVRSIGADEVIDYSREDVTRCGRRFDLILDVGGYAPLQRLHDTVTPDGTVVLIGAGNVTSVTARLVTAKARSRIRGERLIFFLARINQHDLSLIGELADTVKVVPIIDRIYPLTEAREAVGRFGAGQAIGKVVITFQP